jgi:hypothetical protein
MTEYFVKTDEAHTVKSTVEVLQNNFTDVCFEFGTDGIELIAIDKKTPYTKLAYLNWKSGDFNEFKCNKPKNVGINLQHFYKLLKTIKKKDSLSFELSKSDVNKLSINKIVAGYQPSNSKIQIQRRQLIDVEFNNDDYRRPILIATQAFQRACKEINQLSKVTTISSKGNYLCFSCDVDGMYKHEVPFGVQDPDSTEDEWDDDFDTKTLMGLIKISSLKDKMHVYPPKDHGKSLKIEVRTGELGVLTFYIRSRSEIQALREN